METLVWTRGRTFPLSRLESRLSCPQCRSRSAKIGNRYVTADSLWQQGGRSEAWRSCTTGKERRITRWEHEHVLEAVQRRLDEHPEKMRQRRETGMVIPFYQFQ